SEIRLQRRAIDETGFAQAQAECCHKIGPRLRRTRMEKSNHRHRLLRARRQRPHGRRATEQRDELAADHSITSSASESRLSEILTPSALAVFRLITNWNLVDCSTGKSAGLAPLRMRPV